MMTAGIAERRETMPAGADDQAGGAVESGIVDFGERGWLPRHVRGDRAAFAALLAAYRRPIYGYLVRSGVASAERDDLFQIIFLRVHQAAASYQPARPLKPWLYAIAANAVRNHFRDGRAARLNLSPDDPPELPDGQPGPERALEARQAVHWLAGAIAELPEAQRQVLLLVSVAGLAQAEAAEALAMPLNTVKTHLRRARLSLAEARLRREASASPSGGAT